MIDQRAQETMEPASLLGRTAAWLGRSKLDMGLAPIGQFSEYEASLRQNRSSISALRSFLETSDILLKLVPARFAPFRLPRVEDQSPGFPARATRPANTKAFRLTRLWIISQETSRHQAETAPCARPDRSGLKSGGRALAGRARPCRDPCPFAAASTADSSSGPRPRSGRDACRM